MKALRSAFVPLLLPLTICALVFASARAPFLKEEISPPVDRTATPAVQSVDHFLQARWEEVSVTPAQPAADLQILRRLSLALHGAVPPGPGGAAVS